MVTYELLLENEVIGELSFDSEKIDKNLLENISSENIKKIIKNVNFKRKIEKPLNKKLLSILNEPESNDEELEILTPEQNKAIEKVEDNIKNGNQMFSIIGYAGTGKTYTTSHLIKVLLNKNLSVVVTAPTHKAVSVIKKALIKNGVNIEKTDIKTLHSFLGLKEKKNYNTGEIYFVPSYDKTRSKCNVLIVDESSMVGEELFKIIEEKISMGDVGHVIFVGDKYQLPPVTEEKSDLQKPFLIKNQYMLNKIVRQAKDSYIIKIATEIREQIQNKNYTNNLTYFFDDKDVEIFYNENEILEDFFKNDEWYNEDKIFTTFTNKDVDLINRKIRRRFWYDQGVKPNREIIEGERLIFQEPFVKNERVIFQNNEIIKVADIEIKQDDEIGIKYFDVTSTGNEKFRVVLIDEEEKYRKYLNSAYKNASKCKDKDTRKMLWANYFEIKETYARVKYPFAMTIHKLQGSDYKDVYIDLRFINNLYKNKDNKEFFLKLLYVAVTRAKENIKIMF